MLMTGAGIAADTGLYQVIRSERGDNEMHTYIMLIDANYRRCCYG